MSVLNVNKMKLENCLVGWIQSPLTKKTRRKQDPENERDKVSFLRKRWFISRPGSSYPIMLRTRFAPNQRRYDCWNKRVSVKQSLMTGSGITIKRNGTLHRNRSLHRQPNVRRGGSNWLIFLLNL